MKRAPSLLVLILASCNASSHEPAVDAGAGRILETLVEGEFYALDSNLDPFTTLVVAFDSREAELRITGKAVDTFDIDLDRLTFTFDDRAGRTLTAKFQPESEHRFDGTLRRCDDACELASATLAPLTLAPEQATGYELRGEFRGEAWPASIPAELVVTNGTAYIARGTDGLRVVDIRDVTAPVEVAHLAPLELDDVWNDVRLYDGRWLLVASSRAGLRLLDVAEPQSPRAVVDYPGVENSAHNLWVQGNTVYVARVGSFGGLLTVDLTNPTAPREIADVRFDECPSVHDVHVSGALAMLSCLDDGFRLYDLSDPTMPRPLAHLPLRAAHSAFSLGDGRWLTTSERSAAAVDVIGFYDGALERVASFSTPSAAAPHDLTCNGPRCWVAHYQEGLVELELDADSPRIAAHFPTWHGPGHEFLEGAAGVAVSRPWVYVADTQRGLLILEQVGDE